MVIQLNRYSMQVQFCATRNRYTRCILIICWYGTVGWSPVGGWSAYSSPSGSSCIPPGLQLSRPCPATWSGQLARESEAGSVQTSFTLNKLPAHVILHSPQVLWRWVSDEATGVITLEVVAVDLHTGGSGYWVALY